MHTGDRCICNESATISTAEYKSTSSNPHPIRIVKVNECTTSPVPPPPPPPPTPPLQFNSQTTVIKDAYTVRDRPDVCGDPIYGPSYRPGSVHDMLCRESLEVLDRPI